MDGILFVAEIFNTWICQPVGEPVSLRSQVTVERGDSWLDRPFETREDNEDEDKGHQDQDIRTRTLGRDYMLFPSDGTSPTSRVHLNPQVIWSVVR